MRCYAPHGAMAKRREDFSSSDLIPSARESLCWTYIPKFHSPAQLFWTQNFKEFVARLEFVRNAAFCGRLGCCVLTAYEVNQDLASKSFVTSSIVRLMNGSFALE